MNYTVTWALLPVILQALSPLCSFDVEDRADMVATRDVKGDMVAARHPTLGCYDMPAFKHLAMAEKELHKHLNITTMVCENLHRACAVLDQAVVMLGRGWCSLMS